VWSVLITLLVLRQRIDRQRLFGVALGLCGMLLLLGDDVLAVGRAPLGTLLMLGAALSWAIGTVLISRYPVGLPLTAFAAWQTLLSWGLITVLSLIFEQGPFHPFHLSPWAQFGAWYNGLVSFIFCFWAWTKISSQAPPTVSSMATLMNPVIGVFSGMLILGERPQWKEYLALALVVLAMATVLRPRRAA
jgi:drug/metabolite transporter (DMT)-like permease